MNTTEAVEKLSPDQCWALLRTATIGRLATIVDNRPEIVPINFVVDHGTVVFRSAPGLKLAALRQGTAIAFEADRHLVEDSTAWSVVIHGYLEPLLSFDPVTTDELPLYPLQVGPKPRFVRLVPDLVTGRRFATVDPETWRTFPEPARRQAWE